MRGIILILCSGISFCVMSGLIKYASDISSFKTTLFRFIIGLGLLGTAALFKKIELKFVNKTVLFIRGLVGGTAVFLFFLSISKLGMGKGTVICYSYPIFASILSAVFLHENVPPVKWAAIFFAFIGIYLLASQKDPDSNILLSFGIYEILAITGAILGGTAIVLVKHLHSTDSTYAIFFAQCVVGLWLVVIPANVFPSSSGYSSGILLLLIGITAATGQLLMTEGYRHVTVSTGSILAMMVPVYNMLTGILIFKEPLTVMAITGSVIILGSSSFVLLKK
ncbi:MAG: DMT family transporter [Desulfobacterales bacterium]|nr:DMT family transporter [Desulfobacterales bacterium]